MCGCLLHAPSWGPDLAHNPGICPGWKSNPPPFGSQASAQSTEPHLPGQKCLFDGWGETDVPATLASGRPSPTAQCGESQARSSEPLRARRGARTAHCKAPPASHSPAGASGHGPLGTSLPPQALSARPAPAKAQLGANPASSLHKAGLPCFPLEGGQAWGRRAGQATPAPGERRPARSGEADTRTLALGSRPAESSPVPLGGEGGHRAGQL